MSRRAARLAGFSAAAGTLALALAAPVSSAARRHRLHFPTPPLPSTLSVDEQEWSVTPSHTVVAAGTVTFHGYDRGMDAHNLTIAVPGGAVLGAVSLQSGQSGTLTAHLRPGTYVLYCSLFAGTPESHYMKGMHTLITVR